MSRCFTTLPPRTNTARTQAIGRWTKKWDSLCFKIQSKTIKLWHWEIKKRCHQCRMNPMQFIFINYRLFRDKVILFSWLICNVCLTWLVPSISLVFISVYIGNGHFMLMKYMNMSHVPLNPEYRESVIHY